jgi:hypothetical protein
LNANVEAESASQITSLRALFNADGEVGNLRIGDVIRFETGTIDPTGANVDISGTQIMTIKENSTLQSLAEAIQAVLRASGAGDESVIVNPDGSLRFTAGAQALANMKFEVVDGTGAQQANQTAFLQTVLFDANAADGDATDIDVAANNQTDTAGSFRQADVTTSIDVYDSQGNARTVTSCSRAISRKATRLTGRQSCLMRMVMPSPAVSPAGIRGPSTSPPRVWWLRP